MALVISRKSGEKLFVGEAEIRVRLTKGIVNLAIVAPKHVKVLRGELKNAAA